MSRNVKKKKHAAVVNEKKNIDAQRVKIRGWNYIQEHNKFVSAVPDMEPFCGKEVTIVRCIAESPAPNIPSVYLILEDGAKYWWSQEWFENGGD